MGRRRSGRALPSALPSRRRVLVISCGFLAASVALGVVAYVERGAWIAWVALLGALAGLTCSGMGFAGLWLSRDMTEDEVAAAYEQMKQESS